MDGGRSSADAGDIYDVVGPILFGPGLSWAEILRWHVIKISEGSEMDHGYHKINSLNDMFY